jgi:uncharacterized protein
MINEKIIPEVPAGLIEGRVEGYKYFYNPQGHHGVLVLFGDALDVFNLCKRRFEFREMASTLPWAKNNKERVEKILNGLAKTELIGLGKDYSEKLQTERRKSTKKIMTVWLQLTDACNLSCEYCCITKKPTRMGLDMAKKIVEKIVIDSGHNGFEEVLVKIAGGEPMLFWADAKGLIDWAETRFVNSKLKVRFHIITNGTLLTQTFNDYIRQGRVGISVSLDGVGKWHDVQRPYLNGDGSFKKVDANINKLLTEGINFNILAVITEKNADGLTELAKYCLERNLAFRFGFYRNTPTLSSEIDIDNKNLIRELKKCYSWIGQNLPEKNLQSLHKLADIKLDGPKTRNCGIGSNSLTVDHDGDLSICHYEMDVSLGNIFESDIIRLITDQNHYDLDGTHVDQVPGCCDCEWRYACGGGCPLLTKQHFGKMRHSSPYCEVYKAILPDLVELNALQLVKGFEKKQKQQGVIVC